MTSIWQPLKELIKSHAPLSGLDEKIYKAIYKHFQKSTEPLPISKLNEMMSHRHLIPSEKTMATVNTMAKSKNGERPIITIEAGNITPDDNFYQTNA